MSELITSTQNPRIKNIVKLQEKSSERRSQGLIVIEGLRELGMAVASGIHIQQLYYCKAIQTQVPDIAAGQSIEISKEVFDKIAYRENSDGVLAVAQPKNKSLDDLVLNAHPFIIILESVEKPGNLGAILRTADAAQVDALIICDPKTDLYNPNVIRSSIGCVFSNQIATTSNEDALAWLKKKKIRSYAAALTASNFYDELDLTEATAIVMGTEADGLSEFWLNAADLQIKIPMRGKIDSLNVSTATAVLVFEAMRQRKKK